MQTTRYRSPIKNSIWTHDRVIRLLELHNATPRVFPFEIAQILNAEFGLAVNRGIVGDKLRHMVSRGDKPGSIWTEEVVSRLRELYFSEAVPARSVIASTLAREFDIHVTRNAVISALKRLEIKGREADKDQPAKPKAPRKPRESKPRQRYTPGSRRITTVFDAVDMPELRAVPLEPRAPNLLITDLDLRDCRYPLPSEGDALPYFFCGHPQAEGSSYCGHHHAITRGVGTSSERAANRMGHAA